MQKHLLGNFCAIDRSIVPSVNESLEMIYIQSGIPVCICVRMCVKVLLVYRLAIEKSSMIIFVSSILPMPVCWGGSLA
jgi:hypothetical protein